MFLTPGLGGRISCAGACQRFQNMSGIFAYRCQQSLGGTSWLTSTLLPNPKCAHVHMQKGRKLRLAKSKS